MDQFNPTPLSPTDEELSEINPYVQKVVQTTAQPVQSPVQPYIEPVAQQPVQPYIEPVAQQPVQPQMQPVTEQPIMQQPVMQNVQPIVQQMPQPVYQQPIEPYTVMQPVQTPYYPGAQPSPYTAPYNALPVIPDDQAVKSAKTKGIISFILGLSAMFFISLGFLFSNSLFDDFGIVLFLFFTCIPAMGIAGIILGAKSRKALRSGNGLAKAGLILSIIATAIIGVLILMILFVAVFASLMWRTVDYY